VGCGIDSEFEPRQGAPEISPGGSTLGNAGRKRLSKGPIGATELHFPTSCESREETLGRSERLAVEVRQTLPSPSRPPGGDQLVPSCLDPFRFNSSAFSHHESAALKSPASA